MFRGIIEWYCRKRGLPLPSDNAYKWQRRCVIAVSILLAAVVISSRIEHGFGDDGMGVQRLLSDVLGIAVFSFIFAVKSAAVMMFVYGPVVAAHKAVGDVVRATPSAWNRLKRNVYIAMLKVVLGYYWMKRLVRAAASAIARAWRAVLAFPGFVLSLNAKQWEGILIACVIVACFGTAFYLWWPYAASWATWFSSRGEFMDVLKWTILFDLLFSYVSLIVPLVFARPLVRLIMRVFGAGRK